MKFCSSVMLFCSLILLGCNTNDRISESEKAYKLVNPFIGTGGHGHTYPGATLPFGMVQLSPDTRLEGWDGCSAYHYSDSIIYGFSHTHLSGTGVPDYGDVLLMPTQGEVLFNNGADGNPGYSSLFKKESEKASPGYYEVHLDKNNIDVRLTSTLRVGIHEYTFEDRALSPIILDLEHRDQLLESSIDVINSHEIVGSRVSKAWAQEQHVYFVIQFSKDFISSAYNGNKTKGAFTFDINDGDKLLVKVGISATSIDGARKNLEAEAQGWEFDDYIDQAKTAWKKALSKIEIEDVNEDNKSIFYTALYHSMIAPNTFSDVDGKYRGMDQKIHLSGDGPVYTVFSLWDTFRATHPLYTIIEQEKTNEFIRTFLKQYQDGGILPIWELAANYTGCMIGYHAIPVIADAYNKGIRDYDTDLALEAMVHSATQDQLGLRAYKSKGYIASGDEAESVSKTLEYAYDDWCIAEMANEMKNEAIFYDFIGRAQYYKNIFNPEVGFMQSKMNGGWSKNFDPTEVNFNFTEANSFQYSLFAPQDIQGLINLYGGKEAFEKQLDLLFTTDAELSGRSQSDITGLIGQYAHGNEPSHHMAYLYDYIGKAYKTQERVSQILSEQYHNAPDGLSGNEDCGQMSSWYVLSAMGIYAVTPGLNYYAIGSPHFEKATIHLENGNDFRVIANNVSSKAIYIQSASLNGQDFNQSYLLHEDIMKGGELVFEMGESPNENWAKDHSPVSWIGDEQSITINPYITASSQTFTDTLMVSITSIEEGSETYYKVNDGEFEKYNSPILIDEACEISAYAIKNGIKSFEVTASFKKIKSGRTIKLNSEYSNQYAAAGDIALIDYLEGNEDFRTGYWQGYYNVDFEAIVDLGKIEKVNSISIGALQDVNSWIWFPNNVQISISSDGISFKEVASIENDFSQEEYGAFTKDFGTNLSRPTSIRYVKINAENIGPCPEWHPGNGNPTWLFFDEITIE